MPLHRHGEVVHDHGFDDPDHSHKEESRPDDRDDRGAAEETREESPVAAGERPEERAEEREERADERAEEREERDEEREERAEERTITVPAPGAYDVRPDLPGLAARMALTIAGAFLLVIGALTAWIRGIDVPGGSPAGIDLSYRILYTTNVQIGEGNFLTSAGAIVILLALVALVGLAARTGWVTRLAGALGIVAFVLYVITLFRAPGVDVIPSIGIGAWLVLLGAILTLAGGFMGTARRVVVPPDREVRVAPEHDRDARTP